MQLPAAIAAEPTDQGSTSAPVSAVNPGNGHLNMQM